MSGNSKKCEVIVTVQVFRCPRLQAPSRGSIAKCSDPVYGTECTFSCNEGYELLGSPSRECVLQNGLAPASWDGTQPVCQVKTCEVLPTAPLVIKSGCSAVPPDTEPYGTLCSFYCPYGHGGVGESQKRCQADGTWTSTNFTCGDFQPPTFTYCPFDFIVYASRGGFEADVTWNVTATDNEGLSPSISCNVQQGMMVEGDYSVTCVAMDTSRNSARCSFDVSVKSKEVMV
ncbi:sushi repeat-containing protein SRPX-like [Strongylocentrotus purpuratus]|uniref:Uncharacterized protein n=1 Tax=Strongylocentrotus purpuratus TaxID=7668 RepID=A0A7M7P6A3_STRPU|nr:sushi repeat-containing protein SRPX-like [Strongylocentrotus purpuratus]